MIIEPFPIFSKIKSNMGVPLGMNLYNQPSQGQGYFIVTNDSLIAMTISPRRDGVLYMILFCLFLYENIKCGCSLELSQPHIEKKR